MRVWRLLREDTPGIPLQTFHQSLEVLVLRGQRLSRGFRHEGQHHDCNGHCAAEEREVGVQSFHERLV